MRCLSTGRLVSVRTVASVALVVAVATACGPATSTRSTAADRSPTPSPTPSVAPLASPSSAARADGAPYCGASQYVAEITVEKWSNGDFRVSLRPTSDGRHASDRDAAENVMWQAIRRCLTPSAGFTGLDGAVGASLQDQLRCHESFALVPALGGGKGYATGDTFDIESWRPTAGPTHWFSTKCGNTLGTDPSGAPVRTYRPDGVKPQYTTGGEHE
ncbi:DUF2599 domain-containing protein [Frankia sp. AgB1.9]|uniref:DUF2599 domain-containing protein n=1 Tax=Frankia sp. AgB1.8 TaxID=2792839 RepID=UPI0019314456|nr:DUF2599 domain-containing protein [Frankia sp. AgB1.8]MBL7490412.1 DUF2599 domain-containing protein [Frankia sp. AgW1.1]MBL7550948.1 DUF2599 domain-containing protein [Frankia sp. AgB1.9]MBL7625435.1 DUF2599 domain-containing protein [Frankia sp. AgB1.8]